MELTKKDYKFINNTGQLPGFSGGLTSSDDYQNNIMQWMNNLQQYNSGNKNVAGAVDTSILPTRGNFDTAGMSAAGQLASRKDIPYQSTETKNIAKGINVGNIQTAASAAPGLIGSLHNSWTNYDSVNDIEAQYKPTSATTAGIGWTRMLKAKDGKLPGYKGGALGNVAGATASGAAMGSVAGPWGAVVGGAVGLIGSGLGEIFSSGKQRENERIASLYMNARNNAERNAAIGTALQLNSAEEYGDQYSQSLFGHANGKLPKFDIGKVSTSFGQALGEATARVSNGEVIANKYTGTMYRVPGLKNNKDGKLASLSDSDTVITNKHGLSDYAWRTGDIEGAEEMMKMFGNPAYKNGRLPKCAEGWLGNAIPSALGSIASLAQYIDAKNSTPYYPHTYVANPYELQGLTTLAGLRINPYPITQQLRNAEARTNRAIDIAGGLSGSQRTAARLANLNTTQNNISNLLSNIQQQNNAYRANYAQAAINAGQAARQARMQANQWDLDYYGKAHAARNRGIQTGIANMLSQIQQYQANEFKRRQFNDTMDLYRADQKQRRDQFDWYSKYYNKSLPFQSLGGNQYGDPITDEDMIYGNPFAPRALRKRRGEIS